MVVATALCRRVGGQRHQRLGQSEGGYRRKKSMRFTNGCSHGTLSPCGWPTSSTPRAERGRLQQNLPFNFVTKHFV